MKNIIIAAFILSAFTITAQTNKLPVLTPATVATAFPLKVIQWDLGAINRNGDQSNFEGSGALSYYAWQKAGIDIGGRVEAIYGNQDKVLHSASIAAALRKVLNESMAVVASGGYIRDVVAGRNGIEATGGIETSVAGGVAGTRYHYSTLHNDQLIGAYYGGHF